LAIFVIFDIFVILIIIKLDALVFPALELRSLACSRIARSGRRCMSSLGHVGLRKLKVPVRVAKAEELVSHALWSSVKGRAV
jgi:hypothetical protein